MSGDLRNFGPLSIIINGQSRKSFVYLRLDYEKSALMVVSVDNEEIIAKIPSGLLTTYKKSFDRSSSQPCLKLYAPRQILFMKLFPVAEKDIVWFGEVIEAVGLLTKRRELAAISRNLQDDSKYFERLRGEYERIFGESGGLTDKWRFSDSNVKYELCPSYSQIIPIPATISDTALLHASKFRVQNRFPLLANIFRGRALIRSGQPLVGLSQKRCVQDEKLIEAMKAASAADDFNSKIMIVDARPSTSAFANTLLGAGIERLECYEGSERFYLNLENIHTIRESHDRLCQQIKSVFQGDSGGVSRALWIEIEENCAWLDHLRGILEGVGRIVQETECGGHVLVHCSDGWDRTSQLISLVQLCLFSEYRSQSGFKMLIMKDWLAGGHRFSLRNSHRTRLASTARLQSTAVPVNPLSSLKKFFQSATTTIEENSVDSALTAAPSEDSNDEECPIFLQFIEAVVQLCRQFPLAFPELDDQFLLAVVEASYAGTIDSEFFGNCEAERSLNDIYNGPKLTNEQNCMTKSEQSILLPKCERSKMILWPAYYKRYK